MSFTEIMKYAFASLIRKNYLCRSLVMKELELKENL